jgi:hypothetical protein
MSFSVRVVHTPAGSCPIKLKSTEYDNVFEWAQLVMDHGKANNLNYLPSALVFFAQQFFNIFTDDYKTVKNHLINIFQMSLSEDLIVKINQDKINELAKPTSENKDEPIKKKRGRKPKKEYIPPKIEKIEGGITTNEFSSTESNKKYQPKRK